jgi:hypothetical protein
MTSLLGVRKRAEELDAAVEGRTARAELRPELHELLRVVSALRMREVPEPRAEFSASLRERLVAEAASYAHQDAGLSIPQRTHGRRERRLAIAATSFVLVGGSAGMAMAAQNALPGDALYPIKRGLEKASTGLAGSDAGKGRSLLEQADSRLAEVEGLIADSDTPSYRINDTVRDFTTQAASGAQAILASYDESQDPAVVEDLRTFTEDSLTTLQQLGQIAPADSQDVLAQAAETLMNIDRRAARACDACGVDRPVLELPTMFVVANEAQRAMRAAGGASVNNDHPSLGVPTTSKHSGGGKGDKPDGSADGTVDTATGSGADTGSSTDGSTGSTGGLGGDTSTTIPPPPLTGKVTDGAGGTTGDLGDTSKELLPDELDQLADTLLP